MSLLNDVETIILYTGSNGKKGCTCKCLGCYMGSYSKGKSMYQGNMTQISELVEMLPNLKKVLLFGNPDISVDPEFCNEVAKYLQLHNLRLYFWTSGIGGAEIIDKVLEGIDPMNVGKIGFSVDTLDNYKLSVLKGTKFSMEKLIEGIEFCNKKGIHTIIMPTIWSLNADEDWGAFKNFFEKYNVSEISGHFGSVESAEECLAHVPEDMVIKIRNEFKKIGTIPYCLVTDSEYLEYKSSFKSKCSDGAGVIHVYLEKDGIKASVSCSVLTTIYPEYIVDIKNLKLPIFSEWESCPIIEKAVGYTCKELRPICRYHKIFFPGHEKINYGSS